MNEQNPYEVQEVRLEHAAVEDIGVSSFVYSLRIHLAAYAGTIWAGTLFGAIVATATGFVGAVPFGLFVGLAATASMGLVLFTISLLSSLAIPEHAWIAATIVGGVTGVACTYVLLGQSHYVLVACLVAGILGGLAAYWRAVRTMRKLVLRSRSFS